jgi:hypothetical protein
VFIEALGEHYFESIEALKNIIQMRHPKLVQVLNNILTEGISDPHLAVQLLQLEEAAATLRSLRELILLSSYRKAAGILPLPPHVWHRLERALHSDLVFSSEDNLPPHFAFEDYQHVESLMPRDLTERVNQIEAIALEGFFENDSLQIRRSAARFVQMIATNRTLRLFVHLLPHRPHHAEFCPLDIDVECIPI